MNDFLNFFQKKPSEKETEIKKKKKLPPQYLLMLLVLGIVCMIGSNLFSNQREATKTSATTSTTEETGPESVETFGSSKDSSQKTLSDYKEKYESDLTDTLNKMAGVKDVQVVVTLASSEKKVYEKNTKSQTQQTEEEDKQGGKRSVVEESTEENVVIVNKDGEEVPVVIQTETPEIKGVLIVASGVEDLKIKEKVIEAVTRVLDVPRHKVSVQQSG